MKATPPPPTTKERAFSAALHYALHKEGMRGPMVHELLREARKHRSLKRIFDIKRSEFVHHRRSERRATVWNAPVRLVEWAADYAKVIRPPDVTTSLVLVVLVLIGFERVKSGLNFFEPSVSAADPRLNTQAVQEWLHHGWKDRKATSSTQTEKASQSDVDSIRQMIQSEVQEQLRGANMQKEISRAIRESIAQAMPAESMNQQLRSWLDSDDFKRAIASALKPPVPATRTPAAAHSSPSAAISAAGTTR
jgi:hypothetical protein